MIENLYLDFETSSGDPTKFSTNPWHNCTICGVAYTYDDEPQAFYESRNPELIQKLLNNSKRWINHNIKYDMHAAVNDCKVTIPKHLEIVDTLTAAKIIDSDRMSYSLDALSKDWLNEDISAFERSLAPYLKHSSGSYFNRDYGQIPFDVISKYGKQDALTERKLYKYILEKMPPDCERVFRTECLLTRVLFDIEQTGMKLDMSSTIVDAFKAIPDRLRRIEEQIHELTGRFIKPSESSDLYDLLCVQSGLPVLEYTDANKPSFGKRALSIYSRYTQANRELIRLVRDYKKWYKLHNSFVMPYLSLQVLGYLHGDINQCVRTGRMSMKNPNMQQLNKLAKKYIIPEEDHYLVSIDLSQIEYRWITHYCETDAYVKDPNVDYHQWVADITGLDRQAAKTVNFLSGYGGGKKRLAEQLQQNEEFYPEIDDLNEFFKYCENAAEDFLNQYHKNLPSLKRTMYRASNALRQRGYIKNAFGRHRRMPAKVFSKKQNRYYDVAYKAFNNASQSSAADFMKEKTLEIASFLLSEPDIQLIGIIHDDWVFQCSKNKLSTMEEIQDIINRPLEGIDFHVPVLCNLSYSDQNWADC